MSQFDDDDDVFTVKLNVLDFMIINSRAAVFLLPFSFFKYSYNVLAIATTFSYHSNHQTSRTESLNFFNHCLILGYIVNIYSIILRFQKVSV